MAKEKIRYYRLARPYWDGRQSRARGEIRPFPEGKAPTTATLMTDAEMDALSAADKAAAAVEVQLPEGFYADVIAEVTAKVLAAIGQETAAVEANADKTSSAEDGSTSAEPKAKK